MSKHMQYAAVGRLLQFFTSGSIARLLPPRNILKRTITAFVVLVVLSLSAHANAQTCMWTSYSQTGNAALDTCATSISGLTANYVSTNPSDAIVLDDAQADGFGIQTNALGTNFWLAAHAYPSGCGSPGCASANGIVYTSLTQLCANSSVVTTLGAQAACQSGVSLTPQGRLTLVSNTPVMGSDVTGATSVYYTPYVGNQIAIFDACCNAFSLYTFNQLTMALNSSNQVNNAIYDLYVFLNSGVVSVGAGPTWGTATSRTSGSYTSPAISQIGGLWVNANAFTLTNGTNSYSVASNAATYVGSIYTTAAGETSMQFNPTPASGGTANVLGVYNAYNRVPILSSSHDSTATWTYSTSTYRPADNSTSNSITWIDGLQQSFVLATYAASSAGSAVSAIGVNLDSTIAGPSGLRGIYNRSGGEETIISHDLFPPQIGVHNAQAMEWASGTVTFAASGNTQALTLQLKM